VPTRLARLAATHRPNCCIWVIDGHGDRRFGCGKKRKKKAFHQRRREFERRKCTRGGLLHFSSSPRAARSSSHATTRSWPATCKINASPPARSPSYARVSRADLSRIVRLLDHHRCFSDCCHREPSGLLGVEFVADTLLVERSFSISAISAASPGSGSGSHFVFEISVTCSPRGSERFSSWRGTTARIHCACVPTLPASTGCRGRRGGQPSTFRDRQSRTHPYQGLGGRAIGALAASVVRPRDFVPWAM